MRPVVWCLVAVAAIWAAAMTGFAIARGSKVTAEKVGRFVQDTDLAKLSADQRAKALRKLADMLNSLSPEERRRARLEQSALRWFSVMTEDEKGQFIEATMPTGFKQMLTAFEEMPEERRKRSVEDALRRLREARDQMRAEGLFGPGEGTNPAPVLSAELQAKVRTIGLSAFYSQSSAQTKAELAPLLEELQRVMESGRPFQRR